ncbi:MAG: hypothetical protein IM531_02470 [Pseudanabaena sp. M090S1SP1A06QC]|jgi:hypothetical protein|nr:hypothetical protein [Pseudanabaena sp. M109S1SP1A06QC]MCA6603305.1 hypothetical protein [Pseudanabaena sp. M007S1SP1A06QC]MCA6613563.1 hypothetical protein [Pseudanabaena sp. M090S1SP1A06QC]MCA6624346.1 hypothetical protein [Pseudanabaena sp. M165S2SP1A06QC]
MAISFTGLYNQTHQFSAGSIAINTPFIGNLLAIEVTTKPEYAPNTQVIGYLYQHYQTSSKGYALRSGKDVISLELPETDSLTFVPTPHLSDSYTLSLRYAIAGAFVEQSNTAPIPQNILLLPNQVMAIEQAIQYLNDQISTGSLSVSWDEITAKPTSFNPSSHNHEILEINGLTTALNSKASSGHNHSISEVSGLTDTLNAKSNTGHTHSISNIDGLSTTLSSINSELTSIDGRLDTLETATSGSSSSSQNFISISANQALESNKNYFAATSGLVCAFPSSPSIGDILKLSTGNYSFRVNHGNGSQYVLNSFTNTSLGTDSGIILKPYSAIELIYQGSNLWVSGYRTRSINNWSPPILETTASQKSYTATELEPYTYFESYRPNLLNNGNFSIGVTKNGGGTTNQLQVLFTFPQPVNLTSFDYWLGQFNGLHNMPQSCDVFIGNTVDVTKLIGSFNFPSHTGRINLTNTQFSDTYVINFKSNSQTISVGEVQMIGKGTLGGEISV